MLEFILSYASYSHIVSASTLYSEVMEASSYFSYCFLIVF